MNEFTGFCNFNKNISKENYIDSLKMISETFKTDKSDKFRKLYFFFYFYGAKESSS